MDSSRRAPLSATDRRGGGSSSAAETSSAAADNGRSRAEQHRQQSESDLRTPRGESTQGDAGASTSASGFGLNGIGSGAEATGGRALDRDPFETFNLDARAVFFVIARLVDEVLTFNHPQGGNPSTASSQAERRPTWPGYPCWRRTCN
jgi:hypothetical protein